MSARIDGCVYVLGIEAAGVEAAKREVLRPPLRPMLTHAVTVLPEPSTCAGGCADEPEWDGWLH